jgi:hypothetical protein
MTKEIWFDMDGTIADLYSVENWLPKLRAYDESPYMNAAPLLRLCVLARILNRLQREGFTINIISWLSKDPNPIYGAKVTAAKYYWLKKHLPSVIFNEIRIVPYGTPKSFVMSEKDAILFDDEEKNRVEWENNGGIAYNVNNILGVLKAL